MVYFIRNTFDGSIKVGYSLDPEARLRQLQTASPHRLEIVATIEGGATEEGQIHEVLAEFRMEGEWFRSTTASRTLIAYIIESQRCTCRRKESRESHLSLNVWSVSTFHKSDDGTGHESFHVITRRNKNGTSPIPDHVAAHREVTGLDVPFDLQSINLLNKGGPVTFNTGQNFNICDVVVQGVTLGSGEANLVVDLVYSEMVLNDEISGLKREIYDLRRKLEQAESPPQLAIESHVNGSTAS